MGCREQMMKLVMVKVIIRRLSDVQEVIVKLRAITAVEEVAIADLGLNQDCWEVIQRLYTTSHDLIINIIIIYKIILIVKP